MRFTLTIESNDEHALSDPLDLVDKVLSDTSAAVMVGCLRSGAWDVNGNRVGEWTMTYGETR